MRALPSLASFFALVALTGHASAALNQPDGTPIPQLNGLQGLFDSRGENINALAAAANTPHTFIPSCALTFTVLQRNAGYQNAFGWYNVTGQAPTLNDLHEFLTCNDAIGTVKMLDIKSSPDYKGGEIAFYEGVANCAANKNYSYIFYSQPEYNPDGNQANPYTHLLIYDSTVTKNAFYFGWEDLLSGGDNDFDDLTTFVTGITCSGGGGACDTGKPGICAEGTKQCQGGQLVCVQSNQPATEACDGLDNDCNGATDDGDLCPDGKICDKGTCVPKCGTGEFICDPGEVCSAQGLCVDPLCKDVSCPAGQKCVKGECKGPCDGVTCPHGQVCRVGACVDPCASITCDQTQICVDGVCQEKCQCAACPAGQTCQADGRCAIDACTGNSCNPGEYCDASGACQDACAGAVCPAGQVCTAGQCVPGGGTGGGGQGGSGQGGSIFVGAGGSENTGGSGAAGGAGGAGGKGGGSAGQSGSCGCSFVGQDGTLAEGLLALAAATAVMTRRRRRKQ